MSIFDLFTPEMGPIEIPTGDPGTLRQAAGRFDASAGAMDGQASRVAAAVDGVSGSSWFGIAAFAFRAVASSSVGGIDTSASAFRRTASTLTVLATALEEAQQMALRAQAAATDLNARSDRLDSQYADAGSAGPEATGPSPIPGLIAQAGGLQLEAIGIRAQAAAAAEMARDAQRRAAGEFQEIALMAPSVQRRLEAQRRAAEEAAEEEGDGEPGGFMGVLHDVAKPFKWAGEQGGNLVEGAWNGVTEPVGMVVGLVNPFDENGFFGDWENLGSGLWYGVTHPVEFGKAIIGVDMWQEEGPAYWLGNVIPGAVAAFFTGGGSAALRGGSAAARGANRAEDVIDAAGDLNRVERAVDNAEDLDDLRVADRVVDGRTAYPDNFADDLVNFERGATVHAGPLDEDLTVVQFFDADNPGSMKWWTTTDEANAMQTIDDVRQGLALPPEWGPRTASRVATIPEGTDVTFLQGAARSQTAASGTYQGGATQFRFLDFDEEWITSSRRFP